MSGLCVGGVDPGLNKTGVVVVEMGQPGLVFGQPWIPPEDQVRIVFHDTIKAKGKDQKKPLDERLTALSDQLHHVLVLASGGRSVDCWCIEDPRDVPNARVRRRATDVTLGAAFGVCCLTLSGLTERIELVSSQQWIPKTRNRRGGRHPMKHADARAWLAGRWPALALLSDDECFAAGMVIWKVSGGALAALC